MKIIFTDRVKAHSIWSIIDSIASALVARGDNVLYARFDDGLQSEPRSVPDGVEVRDIQVPTKKKMWDLYRQHKAYSKALTEIIHQWQPDIIHTHFAIPAISARLTAKCCKVPVIVATQHELYSSMSFHLRCGTRWVEQFTDSVVYISKTVADSFGHDALVYTVDKNSLSKHSVIFNGIDCQALSQLASSDKKKEELKIICVGRMVPVKGQSVLLNAFPEILKTYPEAQLIFAGSGPDEVALKDKAKNLGINKQVTFMGWLPRQQTLELVAEASVLVVPSDGTQEGFGLVVAEAMVVGVPVLCSDIPVFKEIGGQHISFFQVNNSDDLCKKLISLLSNEENIKRLTNSSQKRMLENFDASIMTMNYINIYEKLIK